MNSTLHIFNPDNDLALANNNENYQSPASARKMGEDLAVLPAWWAQSGDAVLVPSIGEARIWQQEVAGFLPDVDWYSIRQIPDFDCIRPWGWNPALLKFLRLWGVADKVLLSVEQMKRLRTLSSRLSAVDILPRLVSSEHFCGESVYCTTEQEVVSALKLFSESILKAPYSSSGKGLRWGHGVYEPVLGNWCRRILKGQAGVVVEPLYNKVEDFAMEFYAEGGNVRFIGYSLFRTDSNGAYIGNLLATHKEIENRLCEKVDRNTLQQLRPAILSVLSGWLQNTCYRGYLGVDMMICRFPDFPFFRIHPCVEINLRMNMGVVARIFYDRYVAEGAKGIFSVSYRGDSEALLAEHKKLEESYPLQIENNRIVSGYLSLAPVTRRTCYRAYVLIE